MKDQALFYLISMPLSTIYTQLQLSPKYLGIQHNSQDIRTRMERIPANISESLKLKYLSLINVFVINRMNPFQIQKDHSVSNHLLDIYLPLTSSIHNQLEHFTKD